MKAKFIAILITSLMAFNANALEIHPSIGASFLYSDINDGNSHYSDKWKSLDNIRSLNLGLSLKQDKFAVGIISNRALHLSTKRKIKSSITGNAYVSKTNIISDSIYIGYQIDKFQPRLFVSNARVSKSLYQNNTLLRKSNNTAILYGASLGYFFTKHVEGNLIYVAPNKELGLESGIGVGLSYVF